MVLTLTLNKHWIHIYNLLDPFPIRGVGGSGRKYERTQVDARKVNTAMEAQK